MDIPDLTPENAARFGLTKKQAVIVTLVERRFNRAAIAAYMSLSAQTIRDIIGGMCDYYDCPTKDLPDRVKHGIPEYEAVEWHVSKYGVCLDCIGKYQRRADGEVITHFTETIDGRTVLCPKDRHVDWIKAKMKSSLR